MKSSVLYLHTTSVIGSDGTPSTLYMERPVSISILQFSPSQAWILIVSDNTWDVSGDFGEGGLAKALGCTGSNGDKVSSSGVEVGEHVVGLILQFGHSSSRSRDVDAWIRRLNTLVTDLLLGEEKKNDWYDSVHSQKLICLSKIYVLIAHVGLYF